LKTHEILSPSQLMAAHGAFAGQGLKCVPLITAV
jgi:hypothetical protein